MMVIYLLIIYFCLSILLSVELVSSPGSTMLHTLLQHYLQHLIEIWEWGGDKLIIGIK